jgi:hypothetical protein
MSHNDSLRPGEKELERHLKQLRPAGHQIDRDALMFAAGRRTGERVRRGGLHAWQSLSAALLTMLLGLSWLHFASPAADGIRVGFSDAPGAVAAPAVTVEAAHEPPLDVAPFFHGAADSPFLRLRLGLILVGPEALPVPRSSGSLDEIRSIADWLHQRGAAQM